MHYEMTISERNLLVTVNMKSFRCTAINLIVSKNYPKMNLRGIPKFSVEKQRRSLQ